MLKTKQDVSNFLKDRNISPTTQRVEMLHKLMKKKQHLSPEVIYQLVNDDFPKVSRATVYNNLNLFIENGIVRKLSLGSYSTVFDTNSAPHFHLHEEDTDELMDLSLENEVCGKLNEIAKQLLKKEKGSDYRIKDIIVNYEKV
jgi:Fur family iron response transcriptional regulator